MRTVRSDYGIIRSAINKEGVDHKCAILCNLYK